MTSPWLSPRPDKRRLEWVFVAYTPLWIGVVLYCVFTRCFAAWGDAGHLGLGVGLALPLWLAALLVGDPAPHRPALWARHALRGTLWIALTALLQCYFGSRFFFSVLGMEYHFPVRLQLAGTPLFLYFMTIAYFSTYYVLMQIVLRRLQPHLGGSRLARALVRIALCYAVAFAETLCMANDLLRDWFSYRSRAFALLVGSLAYGSLFLVTLPHFERLGEEPAGTPPLRTVLRDCLAANLLALCCYEAWGLAIGLLWRRSG